jgi:hypothetical protein
MVISNTGKSGRKEVAQLSCFLSLVVSCWDDRGTPRTRIMCFSGTVLHCMKTSGRQHSRYGKGHVNSFVRKLRGLVTCWDFGLQFTCVVFDRVPKIMDIFWVDAPSQKAATRTHFQAGSERQRATDGLIRSRLRLFSSCHNKAPPLPNMPITAWSPHATQLVNQPSSPQRP